MRAMIHRILGSIDVLASRHPLLLKVFSALLGGRPGERSRHGFPMELPSFRDLSHDCNLCVWELSSS
jgi:hypothetical protein